MDFFKGYSNLSQMVSEINESNPITNDITASLTKKIILLGTAVDGPLFELVDLRNNVQLAESIFGNYITDGRRNGSTLMKYFKYYVDAGCNNISVMKITGKPSSFTLSGEASVVKEKRKNEEVIGNNTGNDETEFKLSNKNLVKDCTVLNVKGKIIPGGFNVNESQGIITLNKGVADANAPVSIDYKYYKVINYEETKNLTNSSFELEYEPSGDLSIKIDNKDIAIDKIKFDQLDKKRVIISGVNGDEEVSVKYSAITSEEISLTENGTPDNPFITKDLAPQVLKLSKTPITNTVHVYANDIEITAADAFTVDYVTKEISIKKKYSNINAKLSVSYLYEVIDNVTKELTLESYFASDIYNRTKVDFEDILNEDGNVIGKSLKITKPEEKRVRGEEPYVYSSLQYKDLGELVDAINSDERQIYKASTNDESAKLESLNNISAYFTGGDKCTNPTKKELYEALSGVRDKDGYMISQGAYQLLEGQDAEAIVPLGVYLDDDLEGKFESFSYELALACAALSHRSKTILGCINTKPCKDTSMLGVKKYIEYLKSQKKLYLVRDTNGKIYTDEKNEPIDIGKFLISATGEEIETRDQVGKLYIEPIHEMVAKLSIIPSSISLTNINVKAQKYRFKIPTSIKDDIAGNGFCVIGVGESGRYQILNAVTSSLPNSKYKQISTMRSMKEYLNRIRKVSAPFLGGPPSQENTNSLASSISKEIGLMKKEGLIKDASFQLLISKITPTLSEARIESDLIAPEELRKITHSATLKN